MKTPISTNVKLTALSAGVLIACFIGTGCRTLPDEGRSRAFKQEHPRYELTEVPLLCLKHEAFWHYQYAAIQTRGFRNKVELTTKEELIEWLDALEALQTRAYKSVRSEIERIQQHIDNGAKVYWYHTPDPQDVQEEGYVILDPDGHVLFRTGL